VQRLAQASPGLGRQCAHEVRHLRIGRGGGPSLLPGWRGFPSFQAELPSDLAEPETPRFCHLAGGSRCAWCEPASAAGLVPPRCRTSSSCYPFSTKPPRKQPQGACKDSRQACGERSIIGL
jgi:hypothetical protein